MSGRFYTQNVQMPNRKSNPKPVLYVKSFDRFKIIPYPSKNNENNSGMKRVQRSDNLADKEYEFKAPIRIFKFDEELCN